LVATGMHRADASALAPTLEKVRRAARKQSCVHMLYQSTSGDKSIERQVDPYALVHRGGWWYLVGYCHLRQGIRTFRADRIQALDILRQTFVRPNDFDIHAYLESDFADQPVVHAKLRFKPEGAHIALSERAIWDSLEENPDGSVDVTLSAPDLPWLASISMSFAALVTVLEPPELREMVREWARAVVEKYH